MKLHCTHNIECTLSSVHRYMTLSYSNSEMDMNISAGWSKKSWKSLLQSKERMELLGLSPFQLLSKLGQMEWELSGGVKRNSFHSYLISTCSAANQCRHDLIELFYLGED